ncbi:hypothetical protein [Tolypothrix sp. VBCCA 56010]
MGNGQLFNGHCELVRREIIFIPHAPCPMPHAPCPMPHSPITSQQA